MTITHSPYGTVRGDVFRVGNLVKIDEELRPDFLALFHHLPSEPLIIEAVFDVPEDYKCNVGHIQWVKIFGLPGDRYSGAYFRKLL